LFEKREKRTGILTAIAFAILFWALPTLMICGCGRKAPPEPPRGKRPPAVNDLSYRIINNTIQLSWTIPETADKDMSPITGFLIYQFKQPRSESECPNCPKRFIEVGDVPVRSAGTAQGERRAVVFELGIEAGNTYAYKIIAYNDNGDFSRDSNAVEFVY